MSLDEEEGTTRGTGRGGTRKMEEGHRKSGKIRAKEESLKKEEGGK